jgi:hypothetical protein
MNKNLSPDAQSPRQPKNPNLVKTASTPKQKNPNRPYKEQEYYQKKVR